MRRLSRPAVLTAFHLGLPGTRKLFPTGGDWLRLPSWSGLELGFLGLEEEKQDLTCPEPQVTRGSLLLPLHPSPSTGTEVMPPLGTPCRLRLGVRAMQVAAGPGASSLSQSQPSPSCPHAQSCLSPQTAGSAGYPQARQLVSCVRCQPCPACVTIRETPVGGDMAVPSLGKGLSPCLEQRQRSPRFV